MAAKDMLGMTFGKLTVVSRSPNRVSPSGNVVTRWHCLCACGNELDVDAYALRSGNTKSCGCEKYGKNFKDISGQRFHRLTVRQLDHMENKKSYWLCDCDCGNTIVVPKCNLLNDNTKSCGCMYSMGELAITKILNDYHINHKRGYRFTDLRGPGNGMLIFDFALFDKQDHLACLIEYQGSQHYISGQVFGQQQREITDDMKRAYCNDKHISLHEIRFDEDIELSL